ncbi:hypothetical protein XENOCAPTIV_012296, partial [Xenoophorus captivus]
DSCAVFFYMATSDGLDGCLQRGRSQSDPNILTEPGIDLADGTGKDELDILMVIFNIYLEFRRVLICFIS